MKKKSGFKKLLKVLLWTLVGVVAFVVLLVATLPLWIGAVVCPVANSVAPKITKTEFNLGHLAVNPYTGRLEVGDFLLGNPEGYSDPRAVELGKLVVDVDVPSLASDVIHIEELTIDGCFVSYSIGGTNKIDNISQILLNVSGDKEDVAEAREDAEPSPTTEAEAKDAAKDASEEIAEEAPGKKRRIIIDRVTVRGVKVKLQMITIPVPSMTFEDIGKDVGGVSPADAVGAIWDRILKGSTDIGKGLSSAIGGLLGGGASAVGDGAGAAADAVGEGAEKAADAVKDSAETAVEAVGEGTKKAADAVKNIFGL